MIGNRPSELSKIPCYGRLPRLPVMIDREKLPDLLKFDVFELCGLMPITRQISELCPEGIQVQPSTEVVSYYRKNCVKFLMVSIIVNCCIFTESEGILKGYPYSISILPASKRNQLDYADADFAATFDLENMPIKDCIYLNFDPFLGSWDLFGSYGLFSERNGIKDCHSDMIGFVMGAYFLADRFERNDILLSDIATAPTVIKKKYRRFRIKRYFNPFNDLRPRRIWGAESPIELFLMQGLIAHGHSPVPQYLIFKNGDAYPSYHDIFLDKSFKTEQSLLTSVDIYFPDRRLAIFCDSKQHHRSKKDQMKDEKISGILADLGFTTVRVPGPMIVNDFNNAMNLVLNRLQA